MGDGATRRRSALRARLLTWTVQCRREKQSIPPRNIYFEIAKPPACGTFTLKITQPVFKIY